MPELAPTYRTLCGVRLDNSIPLSSPASPLASHLPSTCFNDVVLVPLASWIFYVALCGWALWYGSRRREGRGAATHQHRGPLQSYKIHSHSGESRSRRRWVRAATVLYTALILASLLMNILEIVRLALVKPSSRGVGLLPFNLASILVLLALIHLPLPLRVRTSVSLLSLCFWVPSLVFTAIKVRVLALMGKYEPRLGTEYLDSDETLDVGVIVGLYGIFVIVESVRAWRLWRCASQGGPAVDASVTYDEKHRPADE
ncbi:unnamed protein product [Parajaminaea phylloscopi]